MKRWIAGMFVIFSASVQAAPPLYDHIVVVVEENHSFNQIIGSPDAPFINSLANGGALVTDMFGITHPSQPNYLNLFSGNSQGQNSNNIPANIPFTTANLGASLIAAGRTFTGFSESLPSVGYQGASFTANPMVDEYVRKHNPWMNWISPEPTGNQLPMTVAQPFTSFPSNYSMLPTVSFVIPNEQHNMHDGSVSEADSWLNKNISRYSEWARDNNSLLIVTWDEDNFSEWNRIPTIFSGAGVRQGQVLGSWTLHNLLRTIENASGAGYSCNSTVQPITGVFTSDPVTSVETFQQGMGGYISVTDTWIDASSPNVPHGVDEIAVIGELTQGLIKFDDLFSDGGIPEGAAILSAKLTILTSSQTSEETLSIHRMLVPWTEDATWSTFGEGIATDNTQATSLGEFQLNTNSFDNKSIFDVTESLRIWQADPNQNHGWLMDLSFGVGGWTVWLTSEATSTINLRPQLSVVYSVPAVPEPEAWTLITSACIAAIARLAAAKK